MSTNQRVWLITGTSSGFGRELTLQLLERGDKVIATARGRSVSKLADLKEKGADTYELDVNASLEDLHAFAKKAVEVHGRIDVLVNNAGYMEVGMLEINTPEETLQQFNTNVFAPLNLNRAFLPYMRQRRSGTVVWIGSIGGWRGASGAGLYAATKHTVRALAETLDMEIQPFGLRSICFEPGYFRTSFLTPDNAGHGKAAIPDYQEMVESTNTRFRAINGKQPGDPKKAVQVIIDVVRGEGMATGREIPTVIVLGSDAYCGIKGIAETVLGRLEAWKDVTCSTDLPK